MRIKCKEHQEWWEFEIKLESKLIGFVCSKDNEGYFSLDEFQKKFGFAANVLKSQANYTEFFESGGGIIPCRD